jgi:hypothetical protein
MAWYSSGISFPVVNYNWENTNISGATALSVKSSVSSNLLTTLIWRKPNPTSPSNFIPRTFYTDKSYLFKTWIRRGDSITTGMSFSITNAWGDDLIMRTASGFTASPCNLSGLNDVVVYHYSSPSSQTSTNDYVTYRANRLFGSVTSPTPGLTGVEIFEINWDVNGFMYCDDDQITSIGSNNHTLGWRYIDSATQSGYLWYDNYISGYYPVGGPNGAKTSNENWRSNNHISRFVNYQFFNLYFDYEKVLGGSDDSIKIYTSLSAPIITSSTASFNSFTASQSTLLAEIKDPGYVQAAFFNLQGGKYLYIVAPKSATSSLITLSNLRIEGGYHPGNNELYSMSLPNVTTGLTAATFSTFVGNGNTINATSSLVINQIFSKIGNGAFNSGIWENGVWNNGWREDGLAKDFDDIDISIRTVSDVKWRWRMIGPSASVEPFSVGDNVSIGNIVGIDINGDRKLFKSYFKIIAASASGINDRIGYITVESDTTFPLMSVERDSLNHKIKVTKNVWLSGAFLNGYFSGVWNYGLFRGYPLITEMYNTHWIDGKFEGGHFNSQNFTYATFSDTVFSSSKVGLTFSSPHNLAVGDVITIDKDDKTVNPEYDGQATITEVPSDYLVITDLDWGVNTNNESGSISTTLTTGLLQNMKFKSLNTSKITSNTSMDSKAVFIYNSWMDLSFDETSATNIGKPQTLLNTISDKSYSENNLFGYVTNDVLASESQFRDSFSTIIRNYKLGTKYKVFSDYIGDSGQFENYFEPAGTSSNSQTFLNQGWTYSWQSPVSITFSRTIDTGVDLITGKELQVDAVGSGGVLDVQTPTILVNNRDNSEIEKLRYTLIQFDLISAKFVSGGQEVDIDQVPEEYNEYKFQNQPNFKGGPSGPIGYIPIIHFNNLNFITRDVSYGSYGTFSQMLPASFLPINKNINHVSTSKLTKMEYFYNKRNLALHFTGGTLYGVVPSRFIIDNLKLLEVDMIPFFQYFTSENINIGTQVPYQGIAPFIDYSNSNFVFLDNINIGLDSFSLASQYDLYSGVGLGIGSGGGGSGTFQNQNQNLETG